MLNGILFYFRAIYLGKLRVTKTRRKTNFGKIENRALRVSRTTGKISKRCERRSRNGRLAQRESIAFTQMRFLV